MPISTQSSRVGECHRLAAVILVLTCAAPAHAQPGRHEDPLSWDRNVGGLFRRYCYSCHNEEQTRGDVNLAMDTDPRLILKHREKWEVASHLLESEDMPPADAAARPNANERKLMLQFLEQTLTDLNCDSVNDPGPPPLRRLNRTEYDNAILDLTGLDLRLAEDFPPDPSSFGFDNIGPALTFTPVQVEQYHAAARMAVQAVVDVRETSPDRYTRMFGGDDKTDADATREVIRRFTTRAFRRPAAEPFIERLTGLYQKSREAGEDRQTALQHVFTAVLMSPRFLIRVEENRESSNEPYRIDDYELATRLSFFLWSRPPDETLLQLAAGGRLSEPETLRSQTLRMLKDERSQALVKNFFGQWLGLRGIASHQVDADVFPDYDAELGGLMLAEVESLLAGLVQQDRPVTDLIDADYAYWNERLAKHYGLDSVRGSELRRVTLMDRRRGGVLTSAALLMLQSDPNRTNVPRRGNYVADRILGTAPPPPPPDVPALEVAADGKPVPLRELLEKHRASPACASCHARIDPLGFALENYDALGRWRTHDAGKPIDASGQLPDGTELDGPVALKDVLLKSREAFVRSFAKNLLIYALGRGLEEVDQCVIRDMIAAANAEEDHFSAIVLALVNSRPFLYRRNPEF
ncbi:MAG: DUF1592 domain-containing protein [Pirellulaceae bacterium]|nr:DUF1592 domain-containing protein [Pirellulaceae bacterium]